MFIRKFATIAAAILLAIGIGSSAYAQGAGPPGGKIYAHDQTYRTVGTPADLPHRGQFNTIYVLGNELANISESAPGDRDWRGGRWEVRFVSWNVTPVQYTNAEDLLAAAARGDLAIGDVARRFECPLIRD